MTPKRAFFFILVLGLLGASVPLAYFGWMKLYFEVLERTPPVIQVDMNNIKGIGLTPVTLRIDLLDEQTGLDEVVIRIEQKGSRREVLREELQGAKRRTIFYKFPGSSSEIEEGSAELEIRTFDRSFWSNSSEKRIPLRVDFRRPKIESISTQHNARVGGSQLVFYRAFDEQLDYSGVKVGNRIFQGFPARGIDPAIDDPTIYVAIYAIDPFEVKNDAVVKLVAADLVGNSSTASFYNKILSKQFGHSSLKISEGFLRERVSELFEQNRNILNQLQKERTGSPVQLTAEKGSLERLIEEFTMLNTELRNYNRDQIYSLLWNKYRYDKLWNDYFLPQPGTVNVGFGSRISYELEEEEIAVAFSSGFEILTGPRANIVAQGDGVVIFSDNLGVFGRVAALDHGLGIVSIYGRLNSVTVREGDHVARGETIGLGGDSGLTSSQGVYFEIRIQGVPVDPTEWWDRTWMKSHIYDKIDDVKRALGIARTVPLL